MQDQRSFALPVPGYGHETRAVDCSPGGEA